MTVEFKEKTFKVTKEASEIGDLIVAPVRSLIASKLDDGKIDSPEAIEAATSTVPHLASALDGAGKAFKEEPEKLDEFINAWMAMGLEIKAELLKLRAAPEAPDVQPEE